MLLFFQSWLVGFFVELSKLPANQKASQMSKKKMPGFALHRQVNCWGQFIAPSHSFLASGYSFLVLNSHRFTLHDNTK